MTTPHTLLSAAWRYDAQVVLPVAGNRSVSNDKRDRRGGLTM